MRIYPAIDIKEGQCVRLQQGRFDSVTVYNDNPIEVAEKWVNSGATYIHIVDLDGARLGKSFTNEIIKKIIDTYDIPIQTGGGIRNMRDIEEKINIGVSRVIIGTAAVKTPELVKEAVNIYGDKIAVGIDASNGMVAVEGWENVSNINAIELCLKMKKYGVKTIIYTDISKDGMMKGPNIDSTKEIIEKTKLDIIASGGISNVNDIENVNNIHASGLIIGKALYKGLIDLKDVIKTFERSE